MSWQQNGRTLVLRSQIVHWTAVLLAAYIAGLVEFWRLCDAAPISEDQGNSAA